MLIPGPLMSASPAVGPAAVSTPARMARAAAFATVAVATGSAGHVIAGGTAASSGVLCAAAGMAGGAWTLAGREWHWRGIASLLWLGQLLTHLVLQLPALFLLDPAVGAGHAGHWWPSPAMLLAHGVAAGVTAGWLRAGEHLAWAAARRTAAAAVSAVAALLQLLTRPPPPLGVGLRGSIGNSGLLRAHPQLQALRHSMVMRAPPRAA